MDKTKSTFHQGKVSIIIPMYNRASLLPETLDSVISQTYHNWECILVDDGSTDDTLAVAMEYARKDIRFRVYSRPSNIRKGANGCRNYGFSLSEGEFIQWFDSDDLMNKNLLKVSLEKFEYNTDFIITSLSYFEYCFENQTLSQREYNKINQDSIYQILIGEKHFCTPQVLFKKIFIIKTEQLFNESLSRNQETEFFIRLLFFNPKIIINRENLIYVRKHSFSITGFHQKVNEDFRLLQNFDSYFQIFLACKKNGALNNELTFLFNDYFFRCLRKMPVFFLKYSKLYFWGLYHDFFPSFFLATKIYLVRVFKNV